MRRLAVDSWLGRIIADDKGLPLDVGPQVRTGHTQVTSPEGLTFTNDPDPPPTSRSP